VHLGVPVERQDEIREAWLSNYVMVFGSRTLIPQKQGLRTSKPPWLKARIPFGPGTERVTNIIHGKKLNTVCESARCPNMGECWRGGTATFMINGNVCTRSCSFCAIFTGRPQPIDPDEPRRVAEAARAMGLKYVVVTAVNRDERKDGGAPQFAATIRELRAAIEDIHIEVLIPDFRGDAEALQMVFDARPDVLNHNLETVPRLYPWVRPQAVYLRSLEVIRAAHEAGFTAKSGIMLGLGEERGEVEQTLLDLRTHGCEIVTIGQYLRPSEKHHPVVRYVTPGEFDQFRMAGEKMGFKTVESGPLVRSSYHARESYRRHSDGNGQRHHES
jgi:lipoyl synthase